MIVAAFSLFVCSPDYRDVCVPTLCNEQYKKCIGGARLGELPGERCAVEYNKCSELANSEVRNETYPQ